MQDYNEDGMLSFPEFSDLIDAFGNQIATGKVQIKYHFESRSTFSLFITLTLYYSCMGLVIQIMFIFQIPNPVAL